MAAPRFAPGPTLEERLGSAVHARAANDRPRLEVRAPSERIELLPLGGEDAPDALEAAAYPGGEGTDFRVHDRTHLEVTLDYPRAAADGPWRWEAYFFVPRSFRLDERSYSKASFYEDVLSYVRRGVPTVTLQELAEDARSEADRASLVATVAACAGQTDESEAANRALHMLRLRTCSFTSACFASFRKLEELVVRSSLDAVAAQKAVTIVTAQVQRVLARTRSALDEGRSGACPPSVSVALRWADEYVSLCLESLAGRLALALRHRVSEGTQWLALAEHVAIVSSAEARHRQSRGYDSIADADADDCCIEHLEFRRHMLKRFVASVLWLSPEVKNGARIALHILSGIAAGIAMCFAVFANRKMVASATDDLVRYGMLAVVAYIVKDRMKALLQGAFADWVTRQFPDRRWRIRDEASQTLAHVIERAGFMTPSRVPEEVGTARSRTREHRLEASAQPERVVWHAKTVRCVAPPSSTPDPSITEILRLDIARWIVATDDPNGEVVFADPEGGHIYSAKTRRVYNMNVVFRWGPEANPGPWRRSRVVVSRNGIERIERIR